MLRTGRRDILGILAIIFIALMVFGLVKLINSGVFDGLRGNFANDWQDLRAQFKITKDNTRDLFSPERKRPYSVMVSQESLKQALPAFFGEFDEEQWQGFWNLIYGLHDTNDYNSSYSLKRKRQLSTDEIQSVLNNEYPQIFGRFDAQMWRNFWTLVFKGR